MRVHESWMRPGYIRERMGDAEGLSSLEKRALRRALRVLSQAALSGSGRAVRLRSNVDARGGWVYIGANCLRVSFDVPRGLVIVRDIARVTPRASC